MPATPRFALPYPGPTDAPDGPLLGLGLATAVETWLCRAFPCTAATRPTGVPVGFLVDVSDLGAVQRWTGTAWEGIGGVADPGGGGAVGTAAVSGIWSNGATAQSVPDAADTTVAFGIEVRGSALVTRTPRVSGHKFALTRSGHWTVDATVRYAASTAPGERYIGLESVAGGRFGGDGGYTAAGPATRHYAATRYFAANTELYINAYQGSGGARTLEPGNGWVQLGLTWVSP